MAATVLLQPQSTESGANHMCSTRLARAGHLHPLICNIQTHYLLQLVMIDYLTVEESLQGYKYLLVIVDHFTKLERSQSSKGTRASHVKVGDHSSLCVEAISGEKRNSQGRFLYSSL